MIMMATCGVALETGVLPYTSRTFRVQVPAGQYLHSSSQR